MRCRCMWNGDGMRQLLTSCWQRWRCRHHCRHFRFFIVCICFVLFCFNVELMFKICGSRCISFFWCLDIIKAEKYFHCYLISGLSGRSIQLMVGTGCSPSWSSQMFNFTNTVPPKVFQLMPFVSFKDAFMLLHFSIFSSQIYF